MSPSRNKEDAWVRVSSSFVPKQGDAPGLQYKVFTDAGFFLDPFPASVSLVALPSCDPTLTFCFLKLFLSLFSF